MKPIFLTFLSLIMMAICVPAEAGSLESELDFKSQSIARFLKTKDFQEVSFAPIGGIQSATGVNRIVLMLEERLASHGIDVVSAAKAKVQLDVEIEFGPEDEFGATLFIEFELKDNRGRKLHEWSGEFDSEKAIAKIDNAEDVQKVLSIPFADLESSTLHPNASDKLKAEANLAKLKALAKAMKHPKSYLNGTHVSADSEGLFGMEIVTTSDSGLSSTSYKGVTPRLVDGVAEVGLDKGDLVGVRLFNRSKREVAVEVCLDGISSFQFSSLKARHYMVPAGKSILVRGFHQTFEKETSIHTYKHFTIVDYLDSAWLKAQQDGVVDGRTGYGSISAHFSRTSNDRGFGQGKKFTEKAKVKKRTIGPVVETIVVRYEKPAA